MHPDGGVLGLEECVDLETALGGVTINPARQIGVADQVGTLEVKKADFVVLDRDLRGVARERLHELVVEETWIGGMIAFKRGLQQ